MLSTVATHAARNSRLISGGVAFWMVMIPRSAPSMVIYFTLLGV